MQLSFVTVFNLVTIFFISVSSSSKSKKTDNAPISSVFEAFGYSPACVASALTSCEFTSKKDFSINVVDLIEVIKALVQEMKLDHEREKENTQAIWNRLSNITNTLENMEIILQEVNREKETFKLSTNSIDYNTNIGSSLAEIQTVFFKMEQEIKEAKNHYSKDGKPEQKYFRNCAEIKLNGDSASGIRTVYPYPNCEVNPRPVKVQCDQVTDDGGWTIIQNRDYLPVRENFLRSWQEYVRGFGNLTGEYWLGLENIHALTSSAQMELRIDLEDWDFQKRWAKYGIFHVGDASSKFVLSIGRYTGDAGDGITSSNPHWQSNGIKFSTPDNDNDGSSGQNCAEREQGAWWHNACSPVNLNGEPLIGKPDTDFVGIHWYLFRGSQYSLKKVSMKIRPVSN